MVKQLTAAAALAAACVIGLPATATAQESAQQLFERGAYEEALQRAEAERGDGDGQAMFLAAQAATRMDQNDRAREEYQRMEGAGDPAWQALGRSGQAYLEGDMDRALEQARVAVDADGNRGLAHYQLGLVQSRRGEFDQASQSLDRAAELMPDYAYAHYYAGMAHQRARRLNRMAEHLREFLRLAPNAPERKAVEMLLATVRGR
jgi:tetratricopeptide (TPR) repeat protein